MFVFPTLVHDDAPHISVQACSTGSTEAALHITASWDRSGRSLNLHVIEPGGVEVADHSRLPELGVSRSTPPLTVTDTVLHGVQI